MLKGRVDKSIKNAYISATIGGVVGRNYLLKGEYCMNRFCFAAVFAFIFGCSGGDSAQGAVPVRPEDPPTPSLSLGFSYPTGLGVTAVVSGENLPEGGECIIFVRETGTDSFSEYDSFSCGSGVVYFPSYGGFVSSTSYEAKLEYQNRGETQLETEVVQFWTSEAVVSIPRIRFANAKIEVWWEAAVSVSAEIECSFDGGVETKRQEGMSGKAVFTHVKVGKVYTCNVYVSYPVQEGETSFLVRDVSGSVDVNT